MALPKEPRQKMINVMYLVLTAMLALNVSSEILNAFKTVKRSLEHSSDAIEIKNDQIFKSFDAKLKDPTKQAKAQEWQPRALEAKKLADAAYKYVEDLKLELMKEAGYNPPKDTSFKMDDLDAATRLLVEQKKKGPELLAKLTEFRKKLLEIHPEIKTQFESSLPMDLSIPQTQNKELKTWEAAYFHMTPAIAALTIMSKFQNDIRNSETQVVEYCHKKVGEVEITYDAFDVIAAASPGYVMAGEDIVVTAGMGAFSTKAVPSITVNGASAVAVPNSKGQFEYKGKAESSIGKHQFTVSASYLNPNTGKPETVTKTVEYTVGQPSGLTVSTDKTRVFYAGGLENELSVTGAGGAEKINLDVVGTGVVTTKKGGGLYIITCSQPGTAKVIASDGKNKQEFTIPIRRVPPPMAKVNGKAGGDMPVAQFKAAQGMNASMGDFVFGDLKWTVEGYRVYFAGTGFEEKGEGDDFNGNTFGGQMRSWMNRCGSGSVIVFDNIKVISTTGERRTLEGGITFVLE